MWILDYLNLDINHILTLASVALNYLKLEGSYDDVYELGGKVKAFHEQFTTGGRVMLACNGDTDEFNQMVNRYNVAFPNEKRGVMFAQKNHN